MTGKTGTDLSSVLPLGASVARVAAGGGLIASLHESPAKKNKARGGYCIGFEPDALDFIAPQAAENRAASFRSASPLFEQQPNIRIHHTTNILRRRKP